MPLRLVCGILNPLFVMVFDIIYVAFVLANVYIVVRGASAKIQTKSFATLAEFHADLENNEDEDDAV